MIQIDKTPTQLFRERKYLITSIVSLVMILGLSFFVMKPRIEAMLSLQSSMAKKQKELSALENKIDFLNNFKSQDYQQLKNQINAILPSAKPFLTSLYALEQLSSEHEITLVGLVSSPGKIASNEGELQKEAMGGNSDLKRLQLELQLVGTAKNIQQFIDKVPTIVPAIDVRGVSFGESEKRRAPVKLGENTLEELGATESATYQAKLEIDVLYAPLVVTLSANQQLPVLSKEEQDFAKTLLSYKSYPPNASAEATQGLGKENPFSY